MAELTGPELRRRLKGRVTERQLKVWRDARLVFYERKARGTGRGTHAVYDPDTLLIIRRILELQSEVRDLEFWRWRLWLEGYRVSTDALRTGLVAAIRQAVTALERELQSIEAREYEIRQVVQMSNARSRALLSIMKRNLDTEHERVTLASWLLDKWFNPESIASLDDPIPSETGDETIRMLIERASGLSLPDGDIPAWLNPNGMATILSTATNEEFDRLHHDWRVIDRAVHQFPVNRRSPTWAIHQQYRTNAVRALISSVFIIAYRHGGVLENSLSLIIAAIDDQTRLLEGNAPDA